MEPTPGGVLDQLRLALADPLLVIVARLAKAPSGADPGAYAFNDFLEADFVGYQPVQVNPTFRAPIDEDVYAEMDSARVHFQSGELIASQAITFLYVTRAYAGGGESLLAEVAFPQPFIFYRPGQALEFDINLAGVEF